MLCLKYFTINLNILLVVVMSGRKSNLNGEFKLKSIIINYYNLFSKYCKLNISPIVKLLLT